MNRIVRVLTEGDLPDDLRLGLAPEAPVQVTVEAVDFTPDLEARRAWLEQVERRLADEGGSGETSEETVARIRALRDEWDR